MSNLKTICYELQSARQWAATLKTFGNISHFLLLREQQPDKRAATLKTFGITIIGIFIALVKKYLKKKGPLQQRLESCCKLATTLRTWSEK
jgi:hypothetical protein